MFVSGDCLGEGWDDGRERKEGGRGQRGEGRVGLFSFPVRIHITADVFHRVMELVGTNAQLESESSYSGVQSAILRLQQTEVGLRCRQFRASLSQGLLETGDLGFAFVLVTAETP